MRGQEHHVMMTVQDRHWQISARNEIRDHGFEDHVDAIKCRLYLSRGIFYGLKQPGTCCTMTKRKEGILLCSVRPNILWVPPFCRRDASDNGLGTASTTAAHAGRQPTAA